MFDAATGEDFAAEMASCPAYYGYSDVHPHIYAVETFRAQRQTGAMDMPSTYDRSAGVSALARPMHRLLGMAPRRPVVVGVAYDSNGVPLQMNVK